MSIDERQKATEADVAEAVDKLLAPSEAPPGFDAELWESLDPDIPQKAGQVAQGLLRPVGKPAKREKGRP